MLEISNRTIRAYTKKDGFLAFHLKTKLLLKTQAPASFSEYAEYVAITLQIPNQKIIQFTKIEISYRTNHDYEMGVSHGNLHVVGHSKIREIDAAFGELEIFFPYRDANMQRQDFSTKLIVPVQEIYNSKQRNC